MDSTRPTHSFIRPKFHVLGMSAEGEPFTLPSTIDEPPIHSANIGLNWPSLNDGSPIPKKTGAGSKLTPGNWPPLLVRFRTLAVANILLQLSSTSSSHTSWTVHRIRSRYNGRWTNLVVVGLDLWCSEDVRRVGADATMWEWQGGISAL